MINKNYYFGIKNESDDLTPYFEKILDSNPQYLISSSFSFYLPKKLWLIFSNLQCPKLILLPFEYNYGNQKRLINSLSTIELLIKSGTSVIINSLNHSKFMLSDKHCYIGSNNLTENGIFKNIENSIFIQSTDTDYNDWNHEIFKLIKSNLNDYANLQNLKARESKLNSLALPAIKSSMTHDELTNAISHLNAIYQSTKAVCDCYQHLGEHFQRLAKKTKKTAELFDSSILLLTNSLYNNLIDQFNKKSHFSQILVKDCSTINKQMERLDYFLKQNSAFRKGLLEDFEDNWCDNQLIYKNITDKCTQLNLQNLNLFKFFFGL